MEGRNNRIKEVTKQEKTEGRKEKREKGRIKRKNERKKGQKEGWKEKDRSEIVGVELNCESAAQYKEA